MVPRPGLEPGTYELTERKSVEQSREILMLGAFRGLHEYDESQLSSIQCRNQVDSVMKRVLLIR